MNCPSRVDPIIPDGYNQSPDALNADATTRADLSHVANARLRQDHRIDPSTDPTAIDQIEQHADEDGDNPKEEVGSGKGRFAVQRVEKQGFAAQTESASSGDLARSNGGKRSRGFDETIVHGCQRVGVVLRKYAKFVGPGFMVAVAYIDPGTLSAATCLSKFQPFENPDLTPPLFSCFSFNVTLLICSTGNYATDVAAGASFRFKLLFIVLMSNVFAIFLQSLCIKLGSVTGMNLAENCKVHLPPWLNYVLYFFAESAIIATDIAEVIGTAIALNILIKVPLVAGCAISIVDVLIILIFYRPSGSMRALRAFEIFVMCLVLGVVICFCFELSKIKAPVGDVFHGYVPSSTLIQSQAYVESLLFIFSFTSLLVDGKF